MSIDRLPGDLDVEIRNTEAKTDSSHPDRITSNRVELTVDGPSSTTRPDIEAHLMAGPTATSGPLALDADIDGVPRHVRLKSLQTRPADAPADDNEALGLDMFTLDACHQQITTSGNPCATAYDAGAVNDNAAGVQGVGAVNVAVRTFTERPDGFPATPAALAEGRGGLQLIGRGDNLEALARLSNFARLAYDRSPFTRVEASSGGGTFDALVDLTDVPIGNQRFGDEEALAQLDLKADISLGLPRAFAFCMRPASERVAPPHGETIVVGIPRPDPNRAPGRCDYNDTFGPGVVEAGRTPMSIGWRANSPFSVDRANVAATIEPVSASGSHKPMHIAGSGSIAGIPSAFGLHMLSPRDDDKSSTKANPTRVRYEASSVIQGVTFDFQSKIDDAECLDPRPGKRALCASATVAQIPKTIDLVIEPNKPIPMPCIRRDRISLPPEQHLRALANLCFYTDGSSDFYLPSFSIRSAKPDKFGEQEFAVIDGSTLALPQQLTAEFDQPNDDGDKPSFRFDASEAIQRIDVSYRNTPEQLLELRRLMPFDRVGMASGAEPDVAILQRGKAIDARVKVDNLRSAGYSPVRASDGTILSTERISLDYGPAPRLWVYADIITNGTEDSAPSHTIADVLAENVPTGIEMCFRSRANTGLPAAAAPTYCDTHNKSGGTFEFAGAAQSAPLSVDAYIRSLDPSGKVFSARVAAEGIPEIVRGQFPAGDTGDVDFGGYKRTSAASTVPFDALTATQVEPAVIANVFLDIADFDIQSVPYLTRPGYLGLAQPEIQAPIPAAQPKYVAARIKNGDMNIRANVGTSLNGRMDSVGGFGTPGVKRVRLLRDVTVADDCNQSGSLLSTAGYPRLTNRTERYTCVLADFASSGTPKNLGFGLQLDSSGKELAFRDVAIGGVPEFLKIIVSPIEAVASNGAFRPKCGNSANTDPGDCAPPMLNIGAYNPSPGSFTSEPLLAGTITIVDHASGGGVLANAPANEALPSLHSRPSLGGWVNEAANGTADIRIAVRNKRVNATTTALAAQLGLRIPLPPILEIDPIATWERKGNGNVSTDVGVNRLNFYEARDIKLGIRAHRVGGTTFGLGRLALAFENADTASGEPTFLLVSDHDPATFGQGAMLPNVTELNLYQRDDKGEGNLLVQVDARLSQPLSVGVRLVDKDPDSRLPRAAFRAAGLPGDPTNAPGITARIRANVITPQRSLPVRPGETKPDDQLDVIELEQANKPMTSPPCVGGICAGVRLGGIDVGLNLANSSVKRVDAAVRVTGERNGVEIKGYDAISGGNLTEIPGVSGLLDLKRIRLLINKDLSGGSNLNRIQVDYDARMVIPISFTWAREIQVWHDKLAVNAQAHASDAHAQTDTNGHVGPIQHYVRKLHAGASGFGVGATDATYVKPSSHNQQLIATRCGGFNIGISQFQIHPNKDDGFVFLDPIADGVRVLGAGAIGGNATADAVGALYNSRAIQTIVRDNLCNMSTTIPIMVHGLPGDPLIGNPDGAVVFGTHPVPDTGTSQPIPAPPTPPASAGTGDYEVDLFSSLSLCGRHSMKSLRVKPLGFVFVNYQALARLTPWGTESCPKGSEGRLELVAETITVDGDDPALGAGSGGRISADGAWPHSTTLFNSGGGHGGRGGVGTTMRCTTTDCTASDRDAVYDASAPAIGDPNQFPVTEPGSAGGFAVCDPGQGALRHGCGGGALTIRGLKVVNHGYITADGSNGGAAFGPCGPGRLASSGGGAGGGLVFDVGRVEGTGVVAVRGGHGGGNNASNGFPGGGGGGGIIKMAPYWTAPAPLVHRPGPPNAFGIPTQRGGTAGSTGCSSSFDAQVENGAPGAIVQPSSQRHDDESLRVASNIVATEGVWRKPGQFRFGFNAAAADSQHVWVWLCRVSVSPSELAPGENPIEKLLNRYAVNSAVNFGHEPEKVCGAGDPAIDKEPSQFVQPMFVQGDAARPTAATFFAEGGANPQDDDRIDPGEKPQFSPIPISDGYHAFWTVAARPRLNANGTNCAAYTHGSGTAFNAAFSGCSMELRPQGGPDAIVAIDTAGPSVDIVSPDLPATTVDGSAAHLTKDSTVSFRLNAFDLPNGASGLDKVICTRNGEGLDCWDGENSRITLPADGLHQVGVIATDHAGNTGNVDAIQFLRDTVPIAGAAEIQRHSGDDGENGYHKIVPNVRIDRAGVYSTASGGPNIGTQHFEYRFDGGDVGICSFDATDGQDSGCLATAPALGSGNHRFYWGGVDNLGNRQGLTEPQLPCTQENRCLVVKIDNKAPQGTVVAVPMSPQASGWYTRTPSVVVDIHDEPGGSGRGKLQYTLTPTGQAAPEPALDYDKPVEVPTGQWTLCGVTKDAAGHQASSEECVSVKVDTTAPTASVTFNGLALPQTPTGPASQWQQGPPTIVIHDPSDATSGLIDQPIAYRVDGGAETRCNAPCTVATSKLNAAGRHLVTWTARDVAGNERPIGRSFVSPLRPPPYAAPGTIPVAIDKAAPSVAVTVVPAPSNSGWITSTPTASASSVDASPGAGIGSSGTVLKVGGNQVALPARLVDGIHAVCASAADGADRASQACTTAKVDTRPPTAHLVMPSPTGEDGWFLNAPTLTINAVADAVSGLPAQPVLYRIDDADPVACAAPCVVGPANFPEGQHSFRWQAVDVAGNYKAEEAVDVWVDSAAPEVDLRVTPITTGLWRSAAAWAQPQITDEGSGAQDPTITLDGESIDRRPHSVHRVGTGEHEICYDVRDIAGRHSEACQTVRGDATAPEVTIDAPTGWQRAPYALPISVGDRGESGAPLSATTSCGSVLPPIADRVPGVCVSVDGGAFAPLTTSTLSLGDGVHEVRAFAIDRAGHRSLVTTGQVRIDTVGPTSVVRTRPPSVPGWWRHANYAAIDAADGASGVSKVEYRFSPSDPWKEYKVPLLITSESATLYHRVMDNSGLVSPVVLTRIDVDGAPPTVVQSSLKPAANTVLRTSAGTQLRWTLTDSQSPTGRVQVVIRDLTRKVVRRIDVGTVSLTNGSASGATQWNAKGEANAALVPGAYSYRVVVRDAAGKMTESGDSTSVVLV